MSERTDTERINWMDRRTGEVCAAIKHLQSCGKYNTLREAIDHAMDAAESEELDKAWAWFRDAQYSLWERYGWHCTPRGLSSSIPGDTTRNDAVLAAYRASQVKT